MSDFISSPIGKLDGQERLISPVFKASTASGFAFRGEIGIKLAESIAGEKRPPDIKTDQVFMFSDGDRITFYSSFLDNLADLEGLHALMSSFFTPEGKYVIYAGNVDLLKKYRVKLGDISYYVLPLDEGTVYNELLDLFYIEKGDLKKLDMGEKIETLATAAKKISARFPDTSWEQALKEMGPVKVYENRPV
ncbi:MAG: hypothetical protein K8H84_11095 [Sulfuricella denitrificans]|nr:hypothetical protein [Sulfuricella denitrificans]